MQMMLEFGGAGRGRLWLDELAETRGAASASVRDELPPGTRGWFLLDEVSIELDLAHAGAQGYGLIGCSFERRNTGGLELEVPTGSQAPFPEALVGKTARAGLTREQAEEILRGARERLQERGSWPAGRLVFRAAAHDPARPQPGFFRFLGGLCVRLLDERIEMTEVEAARLVLAEQKRRIESASIPLQPHNAG